MSCQLQRYKIIFARSLHCSSVSRQVKCRYPVKTPSIKTTAIKLGFNNAKEMYPEYPLDEPPKLWMIEQIHTLRHRPYWEKEAMKELGLYRERDMCIQANGPHMNEILWSLKHLVKLQPVRFPQGIPQKSDIGFTQLKKNGEFIIYKKMEAKIVEESDKIPIPAEEDWKVADGYRMCNGCKHRRCLKYEMCQKLWLQKGRNFLENIGPRMINFVENPLKTQKQVESGTSYNSSVQEK